MRTVNKRGGIAFGIGRPDGLRPASEMDQTMAMPFDLWIRPRLICACPRKSIMRDVEYMKMKKSARSDQILVHGVQPHYGTSHPNAKAGVDRHGCATTGGRERTIDGRVRNRVGESSLARSRPEDSGSVVDRPAVGLGPGLGLGLGLDHADLEWIDHARRGHDFHYGDHGIEGCRWSKWGCTYLRVWSWLAPVRL